MKVFRSIDNALKNPSAVRALELEGLERLPKEIFEFENLLRLSLPWIKRLPKGIGKLGNLEVLVLKYGQTPLPNTIGNLHNLRELHWTAFREGLEIPKEVGELRNLKVLNLFCSKITHLPKEACGLTNLETLSVQDCHRLKELPPAIEGLSGLKTLIACNSGLTRIPFEITMLECLEIFDFAKTPMAKTSTIQGKKAIKTLRKKLAKSNLSASARKAEFKKVFGL